MRILFFGDSITHGAWGSRGGYVEIIRSHFDNLALRDLKNNKQPSVYNLGVSADTTRSLLSRIENETKVRNWSDNPLMVVICIGTNDDLFESDKQWVPPEEFRKNLGQIVEKVKPLSQTVVLVGNPAVEEDKTTPVFWGDFNYTNRELERSEQVIKEVAEKYELPFVPIYAQFKQKLDQGEDLLADGLHPNNTGHQFIADQVLPELKKFL